MPYESRKRVYLVIHSPFHIFNASRPRLRDSLSFAVRLPVVARHKADRISLENSGVIGSLGELTPNILMPSYLLMYLFAC